MLPDLIYADTVVLFPWLWANKSSALSTADAWAVGEHLPQFPRTKQGHGFARQQMLPAALGTTHGCSKEAQ